MFLTSCGGDSGTNSNGNDPNPPTVKTWQKNYGGTASDVAHAAVEAADGGFIVAGRNSSDGSDSEGWLFKVNTDGDMQWQQFYGNSTDEGFYALVLSSDGGYVMLGHSCLLKANAGRTIEWKTYFRGSAGDRPSSLTTTVDGGFIVVGGLKSSVHWYDDLYVAKFTSAGALDWDTTYQRGDSIGTFGEAVVQTSDGGYLMSGYSAPGESTYVAKLSSTGVKTFEKTYGFGISHSISRTSDGGFMVESSATGGQTRLIKFDGTGQEVWDRTFTPDGTLSARTICTMADGGYVLCGYGPYNGVDPADIALVKASSAGAFLWRKVLGGTGHEAANCVLGCSDGGILIVGYSNSFGNGGQAYLVKTDKDGNL